MKKLQNVFKIISLLGFFLTLAPGCISNTHDINPAILLTGKIKRSTATVYVGYPNTVDVSYNFSYDDSYNVDSFTMSFVSVNIRYSIERSNNKVVIKDSTGLPSIIYFLHPGTNLIDSIAVATAGTMNTDIIIERDNLNNITSIYNSSYVNRINNIVYENGSIKSYNIHLYYAYPSLNRNLTYEFTYDNSMIKKTGINPNHLTSLFFNSSINNLDVEDLGLSLGNTNTNAISSINWHSSPVELGELPDSGIINYNYSIYTSANSLLEISGTGGRSLNEFQQYTKQNNIYY